MGAFASVGVDHTTCPIAVRERFVVDESQLPAKLRELLSFPVIDEAIVLSTCARTEIYLFSEKEVDAALDAATTVLAGSRADSRVYVQHRRDLDAVRHLFRVACGLESQIVGEQQVVGQVRTAFEDCRDLGTVSGNLDGLFRAAIRCSRRARRETALAFRDASIASAAVELMRRGRDMSRASALVLGAGKVARLVVEELRGTRDVAVANRTLSAGQAIAHANGASAIPLEQAFHRLKEFDVVFSATNSLHPLLTADRLRKATPIVVFDLAVPRNVEPAAATLPGVRLYSVDDISPKDPSWERDIQRVQNVIESEVHDFMSRHLARRVGPIIAGLRQHVDEVRDLEMARIASHLEGMEHHQRAAVERLTQRLIDKMFHHLVIRLKLASLTNPALIEAAEFFFAHGENGLFPNAIQGNDVDIRPNEEGEIYANGVHAGHTDMVEDKER